MGNWVVPSTVLAHARFSVSPMAEVVGALGQLTRPSDHSDRVFCTMHADAFDAMLTEFPARRALVESHWRPGWIVDFLAIPPPAAPDFGRELDQIAALGDRRIRADLRRVRPELPRILMRPGLTGQVVALLDWIWTRTIASDWPRRRRVLEADIVGRGARLAEQGWAAVLQDLGSDRAWLGEQGQLRINRYDNPTRALPDDASLQFVPVHWRASWTGIELPRSFALYYPTQGRLADAGQTTGDGLQRLIGRNRAAVLRELDVPASTSAVAERLGLPLASVAGHLKVMLASGLVSRRRNGREVLYWRDGLGEALVASGDDEHGHLVGGRAIAQGGSGGGRRPGAIIGR